MVNPDQKKFSFYLHLLYFLRKIFYIVTLKRFTLNVFSFSLVQSTVLNFPLCFASSSSDLCNTLDGLVQGWRTFFGERAKILKIKFSKLMPCHYIK